MRANSDKSVMPEDKVTNSLIKKTEGATAVEVPYNNYGERGYVDLVRNVGKMTFIEEIKSNPDSANTVIRQFKKMKSNFVPGCEYDNLKEHKRYNLIFTASQSNFDHIKGNKEMYSSLDSEVWMADNNGNIESVFDSRNNIKDKVKDLDGHWENIRCPYCSKSYSNENRYYKKHVKSCQGDGEVRKIKRGVK